MDTTRNLPAKGTPTAGAGFWRPGLFVKAQVQVPDSVPQPAVAVSEAALLYHQGRALVYVCVGPGRYERREVQVLGRDGGRWLLTSKQPVVEGFHPDGWVATVLLPSLQAPA